MTHTCTVRINYSLQENVLRLLINTVFRGVAVQTKSDKILRDLDLYKSINKKAKCVIQMTLTTYDEELCRILNLMCTTGGKR